MRFSPKRQTTGIMEVVVTSLLDINFLLIMFFMMTAQFQRESRASLNLPREQGETQPKHDESGLVVNVDAAGAIVVNQRAVTLDELLTMVRDAQTRQPDDPTQPFKLLVRADRDAPASHLNRVVQALRATGVGVIRIATQVPG